jgi:hypothetical protein
MLFSRNQSVAKKQESLKIHAVTRKNPTETTAIDVVKVFKD